jgi:hypothetical protein
MEMSRGETEKLLSALRDINANEEQKVAILLGSPKRSMVALYAIPSAEDQDDGIDNEIQATRRKFKTLMTELGKTATEAPEAGAKQTFEHRRNREGEVGKSVQREGIDDTKALY